MKRTALIIACAIMASVPGMSWGRLGHATVAYIAEQNLTPKAQKAIHEYLHGNSLVSVASLNDNLKSVMTVRLDYEFTGETPHIQGHDNIFELPHTFEAAAGTFEVTPTVCDNGRFVKNCIWFIDKYSKDLHKNAKEMDDSTRFAEITSIVHMIGDMHCPEHIRYYPEDMTIGYYKVIFNGEPLRYHTLWDDMIFTDKRNWSFSDLAYLVDRYGKKELKEWTNGTVWDWAKDSAIQSYPIHLVKPGEKLEKYYTLKNQKLAEMQLVKAGHRLATILNETFK